MLIVDFGSDFFDFESSISNGAFGSLGVDDAVALGDDAHGDETG